MSQRSRPTPVIRLLAITDRVVAPEPAAQARRLAARLGPRLAVLLRDRDLPAPQRSALAHDLLGALAGTGARLLISDDLALARSLGLGVQLSEGGPSLDQARAALPGGWIGVSRHDAEGLRAASRADHATLSPVRSSPGKGEPLGWAAFARALPDALPVLALGGLGPGDAEDAAAAGASGIAAIRAAWQEPAEDWAEALSAWRW